jgi:hypothetical protein
LDSVVIYVYGCVLLGAIALFVIERNRGREPFSVFQAINLVSPHWVVRSFDLLISCALSALVVYLLAHPNTAQQAIAAGLGATGILSAAGKHPKD